MDTFTKQGILVTNGTNKNVWNHRMIMPSISMLFIMEVAIS